MINMLDMKNLRNNYQQSQIIFYNENSLTNNYPGLFEFSSAINI